jgi:ribosomal-protein-alanine N-acetyltransferase
MEEDDVPAVATIERSCFSQPWTETGFMDAIENPNAFFRVASEESQILGYIGMYETVDEGEITNVAVAERFRGRGIGKKLLMTVQRYAGEIGLERIILEVRTGNATAISLYKSCGFENIGIRRDFYNFPREDADIMMWINQGSQSK